MAHSFDPTGRFPAGIPPVNWRRVTLTGLIMLLGGALVSLDPAAVTVPVPVMAGAVFAVAGLMQLRDGLADARDDAADSTVNALNGAVMVLLSVLLLVDPLSGRVALPVAAGAMIAGAGVLRIALALRRRGQAGRGCMLLAGLVSLGLGGSLMMAPAGRATAMLGLFLGLDLLGAGLAALRTGWAARLRR